LLEWDAYAEATASIACELEVSMMPTPVTYTVVSEGVDVTDTTYQ